MSMSTQVRRIKFDKSFSTGGTSSVIKIAKYSTDEQVLFLELNTGEVIGYSLVEPEVYDYLNSLNQRRQDGDKSASVGVCWNTRIRASTDYPGIVTTDIETE